MANEVETTEATEVQTDGANLAGLVDDLKRIEYAAEYLPAYKVGKLIAAALSDSGLEVPQIIAKLDVPERAKRGSNGSS